MNFENLMKDLKAQKPSDDGQKRGHIEKKDGTTVPYADLTDHERKVLDDSVQQAMKECLFFLVMKLGGTVTVSSELMRKTIVDQAVDVELTQHGLTIRIRDK